ncbi:MAG: modA [Firmicutes bacterium]|nr:modA [Bacillota bacterium]
MIPLSLSAIWESNVSGKGDLIHVKRTVIAISLVLITVVLAACGKTSSAGTAGQGAAEPKEVTVFAAAQLTESWTEMKTAFERKNPGVKVTLNFAGSQIIRTQIEQGAPADVFASASLEHMDAVIKQGLATDQKPFSFNSLAVLVPKNNPAQITSLKDLADKHYRLVVGVPEVPIGYYARQVLDNASKEYGPTYKAKVLANVASLETDTKKVASRVSLGQADVSIAYVTDVTPKMAASVTVIPVPDQFNVLSTNTVTVLTRAPHPTWAKQWVDFVFSDEGQAIMAKYQFVTVAQKAKMGK